MSSFAFHFGKFVETTSIKLSTGEFEVGSHWKCASCSAAEEEGLCADCKESWLHEVRNLDYSVRFEKHINLIAGSAAMVMGLTAGVANAVWGFWTPGNLIALITETIHGQLPSITAMEDYLGNFASALWILSVLTISMATSISLYLFAINPCGERHWKHMTGSVYAIVFSQMVVYGLLLVAGVSTGDVVFVVGPLMMGTGALASTVPMVEASQDEEQEEELLIIFVDEKKIVDENVV